MLEALITQIQGRFAELERQMADPEVIADRERYAELGREYRELEPFKRIVHVERMHLPDPTPDNLVETRFERDGDGTLMTMRMTLADAKTREAMLATGMEHGMEASYVRLENMVVANGSSQAP